MTDLVSDVRRRGATGVGFRTVKAAFGSAHSRHDSPEDSAIDRIARKKTGINNELRCLQSRALEPSQWRLMPGAEAAVHIFLV